MVPETLTTTPFTDSGTPMKRIQRRTELAGTNRQMTSKASPRPRASAQSCPNVSASSGCTNEARSSNSVNCSGSVRRIRPASSDMVIRPLTRS